MDENIAEAVEVLDAALDCIEKCAASSPAGYEALLQSVEQDLERARALLAGGGYRCSG